jgi:hypothetical protein
MFVSKWTLGVVGAMFSIIVVGLFAVVIMLVAQSGTATSNQLSQAQPIVAPATVIQTGTQLTAADIETICNSSSGGSFGWNLGNSQIGDNAQIWSNVIVNAPVSSSTGGHNNNQANSIVGSNSPGASAIGGDTTQTANGQSAPSTSTSSTVSASTATTVATQSSSQPLSTTPTTTN